MKYNQPLDQPANPNAPYVDGNPKAGIQGSIVPGASIEYDQREIVEVITRANARGYADFTGTPCAPPGNQDMTQLRKAIEGFISGFSFIIDSTITFRVHGAGYDFVDLNAAMSFLRRYYITINGHVILQCAGAAQGSGQAVQYIYYSGIWLKHPNMDRISIFGAPMLSPVPVSDSAYAANGPDAVSRANDTNANLAMLRTKFATEFYFPNGSGIQIGPSCPVPMDIDGLLLTAGGNYGYGFGFAGAFGFMNASRKDGLAAVNFGMNFYFGNGSSVAIQGPGNSDTTNTPLISCGGGNGYAGSAIGDGSYLTMFGNILQLSGNGYGFVCQVRSGMQLDGGLHAKGNTLSGCYLYETGGSFINGPLSGGSPYDTSHMWRNGMYGLHAIGSCVQAYFDGGWGLANATNGTGSAYAAYGANIAAWAGDRHISGGCSPAYGAGGSPNANAYCGP